MTAESIFLTLKKWEPALRWLLTGMLSIIFGLLISRLFWVIVDPAGAVSQTSETPRYQSSLSNSVSYSGDTNLLTSFNPFKIDGFDEVTIVEDAPDTSLNLTLLGANAPVNEDGNGGSAFIRTPDNQSGRYVQGEEIISGVIVEKILSGDQILLRRNGEIESLRTEHKSVLRLENEDLDPTEERDSSITRAAAKVDGEALFQSMTFDLVSDGSGVTGLRVSPADDGAIMQAAGLMPGDVIIGLDGDRIGDIELVDVRGKMLSGSSITLTVDRQDSTETINLSLRR